MRNGRPPTHGMTRTPTWRSWSSMMTRCYNENHKGFKYWGGRGITVCDRWKNFENFLADMGSRPAGNSIDRIDNDSGYEPSNCRWATAAQQLSNTRKSRLITWGGETLCISAWARKLGMTPRQLHGRINAGWTIEEAFTKPRDSYSSGYVHPGSKKTHCKRGHELSGENLRVNSKGQRSCKTCNSESTKRSKLNSKMEVARWAA